MFLPSIVLFLFDASDVGLHDAFVVVGDHLGALELGVVDFHVSALIV